MLKLEGLHWTTYVIGTCVVALIGLCGYSFLVRGLLDSMALSVAVVVVLLVCSIPLVVMRKEGR